MNPGNEPCEFGGIPAELAQGRHGFEHTNQLIRREAMANRFLRHLSTDMTGYDRGIHRRLGRKPGARPQEYLQELIEDLA